MAIVWKFGADLDTDQIVPGRFAPYMTSEEALCSHAFAEARPEFAQTVRPGDVIVAGPNFGCGSSREYAPRALKVVGVAAILAPSFARIFYRNATNLGIPLFEIDLTGEVRDGQEVELDLGVPEIRVEGQTFPLPDPPAFVRRMWNAGGAIEYYRQTGRFPGEE
jgi:methanogen homoaconitase small subunit